MVPNKQTEDPKLDNKTYQTTSPSRTTIDEGVVNINKVPLKQQPKRKKSGIPKLGQKVRLFINPDAQEYRKRAIRKSGANFDMPWVVEGYSEHYIKFGDPRNPMMPPILVSKQGNLPLAAVHMRLEDI